MPARLDRARCPLRVDVSVGDPVTPAPAEIDFPALLAEPFRVVAYPIETVLAEKIVTMIDRGDATTRERDFADVVLLTRRPAITAGPLTAAIAATASHRGSELRPLREVLVSLGALRQGEWAYRMRSTSDLRTTLITTGHVALSTPLTGHSEVNDVVFSPDGRILASGGRDSTVRLWDLASAAWPRDLCPSWNQPWCESIAALLRGTAANAH